MAKSTKKRKKRQSKKIKIIKIIILSIILILLIAGGIYAGPKICLLYTSPSPRDCS